MYPLTKVLISLKQTFLDPKTLNGSVFQIHSIDLQKSSHWKS